jgi:hypothetical protein
MAYLERRQHMKDNHDVGNSDEARASDRLGHQNII